MIENIDLTKTPHSCGVYFFKDENDVVIYVGSSNNLYKRMIRHRADLRKGYSLSGSRKPSKQDFYQFLQSNQFSVEFQLENNYKQLEQQLIEIYNPKYNAVRAHTGCGARKGRGAEYNKEYSQKFKEDRLLYDKEFQKTHREEIRRYKKKHDNQKCNYNGEILTLCALKWRFQKQGIPHPTLEAKKYLIPTA